MFISNSERIQLHKDIEGLKILVKAMDAQIIFLMAKVKVLEGAWQEKKKKHTMSAESRAKMSQMMKDRHAKKKMEKENGNSVSTTSV